MSEFRRPSPHLHGRVILGAIRARSRGRTGRVVLAFALAAGLLQLNLVAAERVAIRERDWGPALAVWVTVAPIEAGTMIDATAIELVRVPPVAIPADATTASPAGRRVADSLGAGEIVRDGRLADVAAGPLAAQLGADEGIVTLAAAADHLGAGDTVDLHALLTGERVADRARVIDVRDGVAIVAVARRDLAAVINTFTTGDVVAVLVG